MGALILLGTGLYAHLGDPHTVHAVLTGSSTDVSHLSQRPLLTLLAIRPPCRSATRSGDRSQRTQRWEHLRPYAH
ncbi:hypothetical protein [Streptomyces sp. NPDC059850]|uniref:hypothetical protein n=1 Tax=Streptomyces sp. NPDC059850 TaxID=3346970 RepID=UPI003658FE5D